MGSRPVRLRPYKPDSLCWFPSGPFLYSNDTIGSRRGMLTAHDDIPLDWITLKNNTDISQQHNNEFTAPDSEPWGIIVWFIIAVSIKIMRPGQNGRYFADDILKCNW